MGFLGLRLDRGGGLGEERRLPLRGGNGQLNFEVLLGLRGEKKLILFTKSIQKCIVKR